MFPDYPLASADRRDDQNVASFGDGCRESLKEASALFIHEHVHMLPNHATLVDNAIDDPGNRELSAFNASPTVAQDSSTVTTVLDPA